jgi:hypothetical protein
MRIVGLVQLLGLVRAHWDSRRGEAAAQGLETLGGGLAPKRKLAHETVAIRRLTGVSVKKSVKSAVYRIEPGRVA